MTYEETRTAQSLQSDRLLLLNFLHEILAHGVHTEQRSLVNMANRTLSKLQNKTLFLPSPKNQYI